jgi:hypothetical protein
MKFRPTAACILLAALGVSPLVHAAPQGVKPTHFKAAIVTAAGSASAAEGDYSFEAKSYIDIDGTRAGSVSMESFSAFYSFVTCTGPEFANAVTMNQSTGAVTVAADIDPSNPNCYAVNFSSGPLKLRISGAANSDERISESGTGTRQSFGTTDKYNFQSDTFSETFSGSTGMYTGVFSGRATSSRSTNRTKV